jgi:hypothetical protein
MHFADYSLLQILAASIVVLAAAIETGRWFGVRARQQGIGTVSTLQGAILGLLALMIGFTFAVALSRFEARREGVLNEANAIGTTALRARLLPEPHGQECLKLLQEYVRLRLDLAERVLSPSELETAVAQSNAMQEALWLQVKAVAAKDHGMVPTGLFIQSLNEMIDDQEKRIMALTRGVPNIVLIVLYGVAMIAGAFAGYAAALEKQPSRAPTYVAMALFTAVILLIQDLDRPSVGFIMVSQQPMRDVAASITSYSERNTKSLP